MIAGVLILGALAVALWLSGWFFAATMIAGVVLAMLFLGLAHSYGAAFGDNWHGPDGGGH